MAFGIKVKANINVPANLKKINNPEFWKYAANEWWKLITPYTPMENGTLSESVKIKAGSGTGEIEYTAPYAHYLYRGELMVDSETGSSYARYGAKKVYTGTDLQFSKDLASKEWDKAAAPTQKPKLIDAMQQFINSGRLNLNG